MFRAAMGSSKRMSRICGVVLTLLTTTGVGQAQAQSSDWQVSAPHVELGPFIGILRPSDNHELYEFSAGVQQRPYNFFAADLGGRIGLYLHPALGLEIEGALMPTEVGRSNDDALLYRFSGHVVLQVPGRFSPFLVAGASGMGVSSDADAQGDELDAMFHWGIGAKYFITERTGIRLDIRQLLGPRLHDPADPDNNVSSNFEVLFGLAVAFGRNSAGPADDDGDGIANSVDKCPQQAGVAPDGCPDADGDGITDAMDKCPAVKGVAPDGCPDADGDGVADAADKCPNAAGSKEHNGCPDSDGDGVFDDMDKCPKQAGTMADGCPDPDPDKDGILGAADKCPNVASKEPDGCPLNDRDKDGVVDDQDKCPDTPGKGPDGCPLDTDGDGIIDDLDKCKGQPETKNGYQDADGCPDTVPEAVKKFTGAIEGIKFKSGSSTIDPASFATLDNAVAVLKEFKDTQIEVGGHTDSAGSARFNQRLSQKRAEAVVEYFKSKGIEAERLSAVGYGEAQPKASNKTRAGRAENRRIEFKLKG